MIQPCVETRPGWHTCVVAASGPSLTSEQVESVRASRLPVLAVNDAYRRLPGAQVLYACDNAWWRVHGEHARGFAGERWSCHCAEGSSHNDKRKVADQFGVQLVAGRDGSTFSFDPGFIRYGHNSGFQAVNLALLFGAVRIILIGFDMHGTHFFGAHPKPLRNAASYGSFIRSFTIAARELPRHISIVNCAPGSALTAFRKADLDVTLANFEPAICA